MAYPNGRSPIVVTLALADHDSGFLNQLSAHLYLSSDQLNIAHTLDAAWDLVESLKPEAVISIGDCDQTAKFFDSLRQIISPDECPYLVFIGSTAITDSLRETADLALPKAMFAEAADPLWPSIRLQAENVRLKHIVRLRTDENNQLKHELSTQNRSASEINLLKNAIVWNVAHELRTPLLQVKSAVALLAEDVGNNEVLVGLAMSATTRLEAGVRNITLLNELINESFEAHDFEPVIVRDTMDSALRNLRRSWEHKGNVDRVRVHIPETLPPALGDKQQLTIALQLLIDNALKFSKEPVDVRVFRQDKSLQFVVQDYGIGIPKDKIEKIFESFYQVDSSSTKRYGGMGIGLAIVQFILDRHNSRIKVETEPEKGSAFSFALPVATPNPKTNP